MEVTPDTHRWNWQTVVAQFLLAALTLCVFRQCLQFDFINWDDPWYVQNNLLIQKWSLQNLAGIATEPVARNYAPLTIFSFLLDHSLSGLNPRGFHLTNVLLHTMNVLLVFWLVRQVLQQTAVAMFVAAVFAVHPVQVETVAWISSRKGLLSATFILLSLLYWLKPRRTARHEFIGMAWLAAALMSKALAVVIPPIVLLYDLVVRKQKFSEALPRQIVPGLMALWLLSTTMGAQTTIVGGTRDHLALGKLHLLAVDAVIVWEYVGKIIWPGELSVLYDPPTSGIQLAIVSAIIGWAVVTCLVWRCRHRYPLLTWAYSVWWLLLLPVLNLFPLTTLMNDRYLYLPLIPCCCVIVCGLQFLWARVPWWLQQRTKRIQGLSYACGLIVVAAFAVHTFNYLPVWRNGWTLWSHAKEQTPELTVVQIQWANTLHDHGKTAAAISTLEQALEHCSPGAVDRERIEQKLRDWTNAEGLTKGVEQPKLPSAGTESRST